jgi:hypothetical protein
VKNEEFTLGDLKLYTEGPSQSRRFFAMANNNTESYELLLRHEVFKKDPLDQQDTAQRYLEAQLTCDGDFRLKTGIVKFDKFQAKQPAQFRWYDAKLNGQKVRFQPSENVKNCEVLFKNPWGNPKQTYKFSLRTEKEQWALVQKLTRPMKPALCPRAKVTTNHSSFS